MGEWKAERWAQGWFVTAPAPDGSGRRITVAEFREVVYGPLYAHHCERNARMLADAGNQNETGGGGTVDAPQRAEHDCGLAVAGGQ